ncbi:MAG TPA: T9SS type A sorting domain-containing protein [Saprospiraceae bacterium]|nr:T9SS type A sorting domain-containing protein [Saprospiraceae bacterium]HMQ82408.1 T9SS type A sorting domain-containing protein [Saprospiraceae bacterium]
MKNVLLILALSLCITALAYAQPLNDQCTKATQIELQDPLPCPDPGVSLDTFHLSNLNATPTQPYPYLPNCFDGEVSANAPDVWLNFTATGNIMTFEAVSAAISSFQFLLFYGDQCEALLPVSCAVGQNFEATVNPGQSYYLLIGSTDAEETGDFDLIIGNTKACNGCVDNRMGHFKVSPAPVNGTYTGGQEVQICYVVDYWYAVAQGEFLHSMELTFGEGWDANSFEPAPPASCTSNGAWGWYESWTSSANGQTFGPGFAYDGNSSGVQDGNPGNNRGMNGPNCGNIGVQSPPLEFCWTLVANDCQNDNYGFQKSLDIAIRLLGDGVSGNWGQSSCSGGKRETLYLNTYCPDPYAPVVAVGNATCNNTCDGAIVMEGSGHGPWDYTVADTSGAVIFTSTGVMGADTATNVCAGIWVITIVDVFSGEIRTLNAVIGADQAPAITASYQLPCYQGEAISLFAQATPALGATYQWYGPGGYSSQLQNPLVIQPGTYTVEASVANCSSETFLLTVPPVPDFIVNVAADTLYACPGEPLTLTAEGGATNITWYSDGGATVVGTGASITVSPSVTTTYLVNGSTGPGCGGFDQVTVVVVFSPSLSTNVEGTICPGVGVNLEVSSGDSFLWSTGDTTAAITVFPDASTNYNVMVTDGFGCAYVLSTFVSVAGDAGLFISPDQTICAGESASLFASGGILFHWNTGEITNTITVTPTQTTTYTAFYTTSQGCEFEKTTTVTVYPQPDIVAIPDSTTICLGDTVLLRVFEGDDLYWDTLVAPIVTTSYAIPLDPGLGCQDLGAIFVEVLPLPSVFIMGDDLICDGDSITLTAIGSGTPLWSTGATDPSISVLPDGSETYSVTLTDSNGCSNSDEITVVHAPLPDAPAIQCSATLNAILFTWEHIPGLAYGVSVLEGPNGVLNPGQYEVKGLTPGQPVEIRLTFTNEWGCSISNTALCQTLGCDDLSIEMNLPEGICSASGLLALEASVPLATAAGVGVWSGIGVDPATATFDPALSGSGTFQITYTFSDAGCSLSETASLSVEDLLSSEAIICQADTSTILFSWSPLPADTAYTVLVLTGQSGEMMSDTSYLVSDLEPGELVKIEITALGDGACDQFSLETSCYASSCQPVAIRPDTAICKNDSILLWLNVAGWDNFQWSPANGLSCTDCATPMAAPTATTTYTVVVSSASGCSDTASVTVYVEEIPDAIIPDEPIVYCIGQPLEICLPTASSYIWVGPNGFVNTNQCLYFAATTAAQAGNYFVLYRSGDCRFRKQFVLEADQGPEITAITDFQTVCADSSLTLAVEATDAVAWFWSPQEYVSCAECPTTTASVPLTATFTVQVWDENGCSSMANAVAFVEDCVPAPRPELPGVDQVVQEAVIRVYPNPARDVLHVYTEKEGRRLLQLFDATGQLMRQMETEEQLETIHLTGLVSGMYWVRVLGDGWVEEVKILVSDGL